MSSKIAARAAGGTWSQSSAGIGGWGSMLPTYGPAHFRASPARERLHLRERAPTGRKPRPGKARRRIEGGERDHRLSAQRGANGQPPSLAKSQLSAIRSTNSER